METLKELSAHCVIKSDRLGSKGTYVLTFNFGRAVTTLRTQIAETPHSNLTITNMTTLPESERRHGHGTEALRILLYFARKGGYQDLYAVQVQKESESFWIKNGFVPCGNRTNDFVYR